MNSINRNSSFVHLTNQDKSNREISAIYFTVISVFIALENIGTICVVWMKKRKKPTDHLLRTLAAIDMITPFCEFSLGIFYSLAGVWKGGLVSCSLVILVSLFFLRFSMIVSTLIAVDRFLAVAKPFFYRSKVRLGPIRVIFSICGIYSFLMALCPILDLNYDNNFDNDWWKCIYHWRTSRSDGFTRIHIIANLIDSIICVLIVTICNIGVIVYFIQRRRKQTLKGGPNLVSKDSSSYIDSRRKKDLKYAKLMGLVMLYVPLCTLPTQILIMLHHFNLTSLKAETVCLYQMHITAITLLCNPIFYALIRKHYRHAYAFILRHPMVLCGVVPSHGVFDFDEGSDAERTLNFRQMAVVSLAAARFRQNVSHCKKSKSKVEHSDLTVSKDIPAIVEDLERKVSGDSASNKTKQKSRGALWDNSLASSFLRPMPSTSSYFSDQESLPSSPIWLRTPSRPRGESYGSEVTELSEIESSSFQNSPPFPKLSFEFEGFELNSIECQATTSKHCLPVQNEGFAKKKSRESEKSLQLQFQRPSFECEVFEPTCTTACQETIKHSLPVKESCNYKTADHERNSHMIQRQLLQGEVFEHRHIASRKTGYNRSSVSSDNSLVRKRAETDILTVKTSDYSRRRRSLNDRNLFENDNPQANSNRIVSVPLHETSRPGIEVTTIQGASDIPPKSNSEEDTIHDRRSRFRRRQAVSDMPADWVLQEF